jgi:Protein of unknown function (DUF3617)
MGRTGATLLLLVVGVSVAAAAGAELPARKAGLWQVDTAMAAGKSVSIKQCVDAQTDQTMQANAGAASQRDCSKREVQKSGDTITIDSVCTIAGKTRTAHAVITGDFSSAYNMTITSQGDGGAQRTVTTSAKWIGPCAADQKPGDTIMPNGMKMNLLDTPKGAPPPGAPAAPAQ